MIPNMFNYQSNCDKNNKLYKKKSNCDLYFIKFVDMLK